MKTISVTILVMLFMTTSAFTQTIKTDTIIVKGNCGMCEKRIETAAKSVKGVASADWNKNTKKLSVTYDEAKTDLDKIEKAIANAGHDTDNYKADDKIYQALPSCCHYRE